MRARLLKVLVEPAPDGGWTVRAPAVGVWSDRPAAGELLEGARVGTLWQAGQRFRLALPPGTRGVVTDLAAEDRHSAAVAWGQELFRLAPVSGDVTTAAAGAGAGAGEGDANTIPAPTDGVFYSRSSPASAAFVGVGESVKAGQPVGLIEVMKTFNQVLFEGDDLPSSARIEEILVADGQEVRAGDPLMRFQPD